MTDEQNPSEKKEPTQQTDQRPERNQRPHHDRHRHLNQGHNNNQRHHNQNRPSRHHQQQRHDQHRHPGQNEQQKHPGQNEQQKHPGQNEQQRYHGQHDQNRQRHHNENRQSHYQQQQHHSSQQQHHSSQQQHHSSQQQHHSSQQQHQHGELPARRFRNVILVGMPGAGKSSVGKTYAYLTKRNFIDLDRLVENTTKKTISQIFAEEGEEAFRQAETKCLKKISRYHNCVLAVGGGTICDEANLNTIRQMGFIVYLESPNTILSTRLFSELKQKPRPLLGNAQTVAEVSQKLDALYEARKDLYEKAADHVVRTGYSSVDAAALELLTCEGKAFHREYQRLVAAVGRQPPLGVFPQGNFWMVKRFGPRRENEAATNEQRDDSSHHNDRSQENEDSSQNNDSSQKPKELLY